MPSAKKRPASAAMKRPASAAPYRMPRAGLHLSSDTDAYLRSLDRPDWAKHVADLFEEAACHYDLVNHRRDPNDCEFLCRHCFALLCFGLLGVLGGKLKESRREAEGKLKED